MDLIIGIFIGIFLAIFSQALCDYFDGEAPEVEEEEED